ncbi:MAG: hypothetical protein AAFP90_07120, partial [Planctomycetota bacterium]
MTDARADGATFGDPPNDDIHTGDAPLGDDAAIHADDEHLVAYLDNELTTSERSQLETRLLRDDTLR